MVPRTKVAAYAAVLSTALFISVAHAAETAKETRTPTYDAILKRITTEAFYAVDEAELKKIHECIMRRAFMRLEIPKGTTIEQDLKMPSCFAADQHAHYASPAEVKRQARSRQGSYVGAGFSFQMADGGAAIEIKALLRGSPAQESGSLRVGDRISAVASDGATFTPIKGRTSDEVVELILGPADTPVKFRVVRDGKTFEVTVWRKRVLVRDIEDARTIERGIGYVKISAFDTETLVRGELVPALEQFRKDGAHSLIIDLRGNAGGLLIVTMQLLSHFAPEPAATVLSIRDRNGDETMRFEARRRGQYAGLKIAVLVDGESASASEITAGVLRLWGARIFGTKTFGKGSVQSNVGGPLPDGGMLYLTTEKYFFADGTTPDGAGIVPDVVVKKECADGGRPKQSPSPATASCRDLPLEQAIEYLREAAR